MYSAIKPENFYGSRLVQAKDVEGNINKRQCTSPYVQLPKCLKSLLGPSRTWLVFAKQQDAMACAEKKGCELMVFAFETSSGVRAFLVCHPIMLWYINSQRPLKERCTYEIIAENKPCKLYLDIEFEYQYNQHANGERMVSNLLQIIMWNLEYYFKVKCTTNDILVLDSSTDSKFSHHVIFQLSDITFRDNHMAGNFIKMICNEIHGSLLDNSLMDAINAKYNIKKEDIRELIIIDRKGATRCFVDCGVYTRNRHFRLLGCTKLHKNAPLKISPTNLFTSPNIEEYSTFLDSLITYFNKKYENVLEFGNRASNELLKKEVMHYYSSNYCTAGSLSTCDIDKFILQIIEPNGRIRRKAEIGNELQYDLVGHRYCCNIGRWHQSNNIRIIVDLDKLTYYQSCWDPDCAGYRSPPQQLPSQFNFNPEDDPIFIEMTEDILTDEILLSLFSDDISTDLPEGIAAFLNDEFDDSLLLLNYGDAADSELPKTPVPDMEVSDGDLMKAADSISVK